MQCQLLRACSEETLRNYAHSDKFPIPAAADREGYWDQDHVAYWITGLGDYLFLQRILDERVAATQGTVALLDIGCASGRVLRQFAINAPSVKLYGCDINRNNIAFIRKYLPNPASVFQNLTVPPLPIADHCLDFVFALSLFTHIHDFEESWLLEIRRVLKPGGLAFITFHSDRVWSSIRPGHYLLQLLSSTAYSAELLNLKTLDFRPSLFEQAMPDQRVAFVPSGGPLSSVVVFCTQAYIAAKWGKIFEIVEWFSSVHGSHQDGVLLKKS